MAGLRASGRVGGGVVTAVEVQSPLESTPSASRLMSPDSAASWALGLFIGALFLLYFVLF
jgi:hypothetical protein